MRWQVHGERALYESPWLNLTLVDVELNDGQRFEHHVVRAQAPAVGTVVADAERGVLLLWRHRFITDTWGWEIPAGRVDEGERLDDAAHRETVEETGWAPGPLEHLITFHPVNGLSDLTFTIFVADGATHLGPPTDITEAARVEWVDIDRLRELLRAGEIRDGMSLGGLSTALALGAIGS